MEFSSSKFKRSNSLHNIIFIMKVTLDRSIELLTELAELQRGPPLVTDEKVYYDYKDWDDEYEKQWNQTMENVWEFIHNYEKRFENVPNIHDIWDDQNGASYGVLNPDKPINVELGFMLTEIIEKAKTKQNK